MLERDLNRLLPQIEFLPQEQRQWAERALAFLAMSEIWPLFATIEDLDQLAWLYHRRTEILANLYDMTNAVLN